jgi:hypothetical protein
MDTTRLLMIRYGFNHYTAAKEFLRGKSMIEDRCDLEVGASQGATPLKLFTRVTQIDPKNPYGWAYLLFAMEDAGNFTIDQLLDVAERWHETAVEYKHQGQNAFAMMYFTRYMKIKNRVG